MFLDLLVVCFMITVSHVLLVCTHVKGIWVSWKGLYKWHVLLFYFYFKKAAVILFKKGQYNLIILEIMQHFCCLNKVVEHYNHRGWPSCLSHSNQSSISYLLFWQSIWVICLSYFCFFNPSMPVNWISMGWQRNKKRKSPWDLGNDDQQFSTFNRPSNGSFNQKIVNNESNHQCYFKCP